MNPINLVFAIIVAAVIAIGLAVAMPYGVSKMTLGHHPLGIGKLNLTELNDSINFEQQIRTAIDNNDFESWKTLMGSRLTKANFEKIVNKTKDRQDRIQNLNQTRQSDKKIMHGLNFSARFKNNSSTADDLTRHQGRAMLHRGPVQMMRRGF